MKTLLECVAVALVAGLAGIAMAWGMDEQLKKHTQDVLRQIIRIEGTVR